MPRLTSNSSTDAIALLTADHKAVAGLFADFRKSSNESERQVIAQTICDMLTVHATCEEEYVYPAAHQALDDDELVYEAEVEHGTARGLISCIQDLDTSSPAFGPSVTVLEEYIKHHVREEEHELFPKLKRSRIDLDALGAVILARKRELASQYPHAAAQDRKEDAAA
jgi:hemerythrin superfamily protein